MVATNWQQRGLEVGTGTSVDMMVVVIDNDGDQFVAVGPTNAYYELHSPAFAPQQNAAWRARLSGSSPPPRPSWHQVVVAHDGEPF